MEPPEELKKSVGPFLQRAKELEGREPIVAYYCEYYGAKLAVESGIKAPHVQSFIVSLLDHLEQKKKALGANEAVTSDVVGYAHLENFALRIFMNADNEDRSGLASKKTAKTFLAASIFLELLQVFGPLETEIVEKVKYAKFKAADIIKALKEGKTPTPGNPNEAPLEGEEEAPSDPTMIPPPPQPLEPLSPSPTPPAPASIKAPSPVPGPIPVSAPKATPAPMASTTMAAPSASSASGVIPVDYKVVQAASKHAKFAMSALQYDDVNTALENLHKAIALLEPFKK